MVLSAFAKGIGQLSDKPTRVVIWISLGAAVLTFAIVWILSGYFLVTTSFILNSMLPASLQDSAFIGPAVDGFEVLVDSIGVLLVMILTWLLFPAVFSAVASLFLERVADLVEAKHYPGLAPAKGLTWGQTVIEALKFLGILLATYIVVLPLWLILPFGFLIYYAATGYLLGREYYDLVAQRRLKPKDAQALRKANGSTVFITGVGIAVLMTIPVVNLLMPIVATATMVHLVEKWRDHSNTGDLNVTFRPENLEMDKYQS